MLEPLDSQPLSRSDVADHSKETFQERKTSFGLFYDSRTVGDIVNQVKVASKNSPLDTAVISEYAITIEQAMAGFSNLKDLALQTGTNIVLAADARSWRKTPENGCLSWSEVKTQVLQQDALVQDEDPKRLVEDSIGFSLGEDSIGFFFGRDGKIYVFSKWTVPLHIIPETHYGVAICGEIGRLNGEAVGKADVSYIFNPSREGDDPSLGFRMMGLADVKDEDFLRLFIQRYSSVFPNNPVVDYSDPDKAFQVLCECNEDSREYTANWIKGYREELASTRINSRKASGYVGKIEKDLNARKIPVIRCDGQNSSGILNPFFDLSVEDATFGKDFTRMAISVR